MTNFQVGQVILGEKEQLSLLNLVKYAGASGDFNPLHFDFDYAKSKGQNTVLVHGMLGAGILSKLATKIADTEGFVKHFEVRFAKELPVDSIVQSAAEVKGVENTGNGTEVMVDLRLENELGDVAVKGNAKIVIMGE